MEKEEYQTLFDGQERRKINSRFRGDPREAPRLEDVVDAWRRQKAKSAPPASSFGGTRKTGPSRRPQQLVKAHAKQTRGPGNPGLEDLPAPLEQVSDSPSQSDQSQSHSCDED
jgi:hypothetical protein